MLRQMRERETTKQCERDTETSSETYGDPITCPGCALWRPKDGPGAWIQGVLPLESGQTASS